MIRRVRVEVKPCKMFVESDSLVNYVEGELSGVLTSTVDIRPKRHDVYPVYKAVNAFGGDLMGLAAVVRSEVVDEVYVHRIVVFARDIDGRIYPNFYRVEGAISEFAAVVDAVERQFSYNYEVLAREAVLSIDFDEGMFTRRIRIQGDLVMEIKPLRYGLEAIAGLVRRRLYGQLFSMVSNDLALYVGGKLAELGIGARVENHMVRIPVRKRSKKESKDPLADAVLQVVKKLVPLSDDEYDLYVRRDKGRIVDEIVISLNVWSRFFDKVYRDEIVKIANQIANQLVSSRKRYVVRVSNHTVSFEALDMTAVDCVELTMPFTSRRQRVCDAFPQTEFIIPPGTEVEATHREHGRHAVKIEADAYVAISFDTLGNAYDAAVKNTAALKRLAGAT